MKKFFALILAVLTAFGITACGISGDKEQSAQPSQVEGEAEITQPQPSEMRPLPKEMTSGKAIFPQMWLLMKIRF